MRTWIVCGGVLASAIALVPPAVAQVDRERAQAFFKEAQALCERDGTAAVS